MPENLAELAVLSERIAQLREAVGDVKPSVSKMMEEQTELSKAVIRLEGRMDAIETAQKNADKARVTYENKVEACLKKTDEIDDKIEIGRWKLVSYLAISSAGGGSLVAGLVKAFGG